MRDVNLQKEVKGGRPPRTSVEQDQAAITQLTTVTLGDNVRKVSNSWRLSELHWEPGAGSPHPSFSSGPSTSWQRT